MNFEQLLQNQQRKKKLQARKQARIKYKILAEKRQAANLDQDHFKTGAIQKTKIIKKKTFNTQVQKARKIPIQIQDNVNVNTFLTQSSEYLTFLERTKQYIQFNQERVVEGCKAISAYAQEHRQPNITISITLENQIQCSSRSTLLHLPFPQKNITSIMIGKNLAQIESKELGNAEVTLMGIKEFINKYKEDKQFKKMIKKKLTRIFCSFSIFIKSKAIQKIINQGIPVFPIDQKKVPFSLQSQCQSYQEYIKYLLTKSYFITKSGTEHFLRIKNRKPEELAFNVMESVHQVVSRLIHRSKKKGNSLKEVKLKTQTSIPIPIYG